VHQQPNFVQYQQWFIWNVNCPNLKGPQDDWSVCTLFLLIFFVMKVLGGFQFSKINQDSNDQQTLLLKILSIVWLGLD
jgi:hypothetical protein